MNRRDIFRALIGGVVAMLGVRREAAAIGMPPDWRDHLVDEVGSDGETRTVYRGPYVTEVDLGHTADWEGLR